MAGLQALAKLLGRSADDVAKLSKKTVDTLSHVTTAEKAAALKGAERETYLKALDEAYGPRATRASDMGFGPDTWYHGTASDIKEFDPNFLGANTMADNAKEGFFFANKPETANTYADMASMRKVTELQPEIDRLQSQVWADPSNMKARSQLNELKAKNIELTGSGNFDPFSPVAGHRQNILPVQLKMNKPASANLKGAEYDAGLYNKHIQKAKASGADSTLLKNTFDSASPVEVGSGADDIAVVFDPSQIRSKYAAFDPRFAKSGSLVAGAAAMPSMNENKGMTWEQLKAYMENPEVALQNMKRAMSPTEGDEVETARTALKVGSETEPTDEEVMEAVARNRETMDNASGFMGGGIAETSGKSLSKLKDMLRGKTTRESLKKTGVEIPAEFGTREDIIRRANETAARPTTPMSEADAQNMWRNDWARQLESKKHGATNPSITDLLQNPTTLPEGFDPGEFTKVLRSTGSSSEKYQDALRSLRGQIDDVPDELPMANRSSKMKTYEQGAKDELATGKPSKEFRSPVMLSQGGTQRPKIFQESSSVSMPTADRKMAQRLGDEALDARIMTGTDEQVRAIKDAMQEADGMDVNRLYDLEALASRSPEALARAIKDNPLRELGTGVLPRLRQQLKGKK